MNQKIKTKAIPRELRKCKQWVLWNFGKANEKGRRSKIPIDPRTKKNASTGDSKTWSTFNKTYEAFQDGGYDGIGFFFTKDDPYVGIDLDDCRNPKTGKIEGRAVKIIDQLCSFTEVSPSSTGVKIFLKGKLPKGLRRKGNIEIYDRDRYFTVTGIHLTRTPKKIRKCPKAIRKFYKENFNMTLANENREEDSMKKNEKALRALKNSNKIDKLFKGDWHSYPSESQADLALCSHLVRQTNGNPEEMDDLFRKSGLMREKWDEIHTNDGRTYGEITINKAINTYWRGSTGQSLDFDMQKQLENGEQGDSDIFVRTNRERYCFDHATGQWFKWGKYFWQIDSVDQVFADILKIADVYEKYRKKFLSEASEDLKKGRQSDAEKKQALAQLIVERIGKLKTIRRRKNILTLARSGEQSLGIAGTEWDCKRDVLACKNGVLRLDNGEVTADDGQPSDLIRKHIPTDWNGFDAPCKIWKRFLREVFQEDKTLIRHVQKILGYALTGRGSKHIFVILHGVGRNGKTTLVEVLRHVLGPLALPIPSETLLTQPYSTSGASPRADLMKLQGARIVWASESNTGRSFNVAEIKKLTGGDTITARAPFGKQMVDIPATHTIFFLTNNLPNASVHEYAFWQRVHVIPFKVSFVDNPKEEFERKSDHELLDKLKEEAPGILAWLIKGYQKWSEKGLLKPDEVVKAVNEYFECKDHIGRFIKKSCKRKTGAKVKASILYEAYEKWCQREFIAPSTLTSFGKDLRERKFEKKPSNGIYYLGIKLKESN